ncbi:MAG: hypothetical protein J6S67_04585 [Methanobrevibacter sp.]|nr:hypothetical protein [Methanobrevibacter sp.]
MRKRIREYKLLLFEICETLGTISLMLSENPHFNSGRYKGILRDHFEALRRKSYFLISKENEK